MPPAALLVCSVESTRWPVSADWIAMRAVSRSRISPIMMMSGSWRTMRAQRVGEVEPDLRLGLDLVDAFDLVFDRIFDGDDLDVAAC